MSDPRVAEEAHIIDRYIATGALSGTLRAAWRCSCEGGRHCGTFDDERGEWTFGASPERHLAEVRKSPVKETPNE